MEHGGSRATWAPSFTINSGVAFHSTVRRSQVLDALCTSMAKKFTALTCRPVS